MSARWILGVLAIVFTVLAIVRLIRNQDRWDPAAKTWALIAVIFAIISLVLWL